MEGGDREAVLVYRALIYQIAKEIGGMATTLEGRVDAILLTGGMTNSQRLTASLAHFVQWIAPVTVYPGEDEFAGTGRRSPASAERRGRGEEAWSECLGGYGAVGGTISSSTCVQRV